MSEKSPFVVSPEWLVERLGDPGLKVVDASWYLPAQGRDAAREFAGTHIPGAVFFDQDAIVDPHSDLPHTLPSPGHFAAEVGKLGISHADSIVVYDGLGIFTAPRVWWMLRVMGARDVYVLDGGFPAWTGAGHPVESGEAVRSPVTFEPSFDEGRVTSFAAMRRIVEEGSAVVADARPPERFRAEVPEPRPGIRGGHMPGARNVPTFSLSKDGKLLSPNALREVFERSGVDLSRPVVTSCGSGVTAAVISLALESVGHSQHSLYDGSWTEWGSAADTPVAEGDD